MTVRRRLLVIVPVLIGLALALAFFLAWRHPVMTGNLVLGAFRAMPAEVRGHPRAWGVARQLLLWQYRDRMPLEVQKEKEGRFGRKTSRLIVALGDSTTRGVQIAAVRAWPFVLQQAIKKDVRGGVRIVNAGISGETAPQGRMRLERDVLSLKPDLAIVGYLINDGRNFGFDGTGSPRVLVEYAKYLGAFEEILATLKQAGVPVMVFTCHPLQPWFFSDQPAEAELVQQMIYETRLDGLRKLCQQWQAPLVETYAAIQADPEAADLYLRDGMHLNELGHGRVAEMIESKWREVYWPGWRVRPAE